MSAKGRLTESLFDSLGAMMAAYAAEATRIAWDDHRRRLNMSESSITALEEILAGQAAEDLEFQTRLWGSYFGEVIRGQFGGEWTLTDYAGGAIAVPTLVVDACRLYPLVKVYRRLTLGESENLCGFYTMVSSRLKKASAQIEQHP